MFLKRLLLKNIRSIESLELSFDLEPNKLRQWTAILGENGVGKSTILRAIALALVGGEALQDLLIEPSEWVRKGSNEGFIKIEIVGADKNTEEIELTLLSEDTRRSILSRNAAALDQLEEAQKRASHRYLTVGYGASRRLSMAKGRPFQKSEGFISPRAQAVATLFDSNASLYPLDSWAMDLDYRRGEKGLRLIKTAFQDLLQGAEFQEIDREKRELLFSTPDGILPLRNLSDGFQDVAAWWGDLLFRVTETLGHTKNPLAAHGVLLIDEAELHLHPIWQRQLRDVLTQKLPNFQIITTTYSPLTAQQSGPGELFILRRITETAPPTLTAFEGDPRHLKIQ
ncbi:MAG TPA: AAA family ATPase, partial [Anaerolineales bacterium]